MSRPKDNGDRWIKLDLPFPKGASLNDHVTAYLHDGSPDKLNFPTINHIVQQQILDTDDPYIGKIHIARAYRQIPIDPKDAIKLGFH